MAHVVERRSMEYACLMAMHVWQVRDKRIYNRAGL
jgi:hypothetical protein